MASARAIKAQVRLAGVALAANGPVVWRFQTGTQPYITQFEVYKDDWEKKLKGKAGQPLTLTILDARAVTTVIKEVYILHAVASSSPYRVAFLVADKRWKWAYRMIARDYNIPKKSGDRTLDGRAVPIESAVTFDEYDFKPYSLKDGKSRWLPKDAVKDVIEILEGRGGYTIESFPIEGSGVSGQFLMQNVILRDQGDAALSRLLSYIPGAEVYIDNEGKARVFDAADLKAAEDRFRDLDPTWDGDAAFQIDRKRIRPSRVNVHYTREVELLLEYKDDYSGQTTAQDPNAPFLENVIPTVDPETEIIEWDPIKRRNQVRVVPPGTWVRVDDWLRSMDEVSPDDSLPWDFDTIRHYWVTDKLDTVLGARGGDYDPNGNVSARVQALKQHFRQTFRISRRYMNRVRSIQAVRVGVIDPVTGARAGSAVWGQACAIPSGKGDLMASRYDPDKAGTWTNVDYIATSKAPGTNTVKTSPGPARVEFVDRDLGIFRLEWGLSPAGTNQAFIPCHVVGANAEGTPRVPTRDLSKQDDEPIGAGFYIEGATNWLLLRNTMEFKALVTIVPGAPNNKNQFHVEKVSAGEIAKLFRTQYRIQGGTGPEMDVFIPPGESTARFAWELDAAASGTVAQLLGLFSDNPNTAGISTRDLPGYTLTNGKRELGGHSKAVAGEALSSFADSLHGSVSTVAPKDGIRLKGNIGGASIQVASAPDAKVSAVHEFSGQQRTVSRLAMMPESTRYLVLGVVPFGRGDK